MLKFNSLEVAPTYLARCGFPCYSPRRVLSLATAMCFLDIANGQFNWWVKYTYTHGMVKNAT